MTLLDLFSGIGGASLAASWADIETVAFCERDKYCQRVLAKNFPGVEIHDDIKTLDGTRYTGTADVISGGFPCQPFSVAGKRKGKDDDRYLWPEMLRVIREVRPRWIVGENVSGIVRMALDTCITDLENEGYSCRAILIPAAGVGAPHRRERVWIVAWDSKSDRWLSDEGVCQRANAFTGRVREAMAHSNGERFQERCECHCQQEQPGLEAPYGDNTCGCSQDVADAHTGQRVEPFDALQAGRSAAGSGRENVSHADCNGRGEMPHGFTFEGDRDGLEEGKETAPESHIPGLEVGSRSRPWDSFAAPVERDWWAAEPPVGRVAHGIPHRVDRLRGLGNAWVPQVAYPIFKAIVEIERSRQ